MPFRKEPGILVVTRFTMREKGYQAPGQSLPGDAARIEYWRTQ